MKKFNIDQEQLYTTSDIAKMLGVTRQTVFNWIKNKIITGQLMGGSFIVKGEDLYTFIHPDEVTDQKKQIIENIVTKVVDEYGEALRKLGKE